MNLYDINTAIMDCIDEETGEILDEELLNSLQLAEEEKIENIALWIKNLRAEAEALKAEKQAFDDRKKKAEAKADSLQRYLSKYLDGKIFNTAKVAINWRKSDELIIDDTSAIPFEYMDYEPKVKKAELKKAIKQGLTVAGCAVKEKNNIQIK